MIPIENNDSFNIQNSEYFKTLPSFVKETIMQSSGLINNEEELKETAEKLMEETR